MILGIRNLGDRILVTYRSQFTSQIVHDYGGIEHLWFQFLASNRRLAKSYLFFQQWTKTNAAGRVSGGGWMLER